MSKRIIKDFAIIQQNTDFVLFYNEENVNKCKVMFFGPEGSPYDCGIFILDFLFETYPQNPPKVNFITGGIINDRIHPNLYKEGKVCLSILGTWGKEDWSPTLTLEKVCITIRALMDENPIRNEPSHENDKITDKEAMNYVINVKYLTLKTIVDTVKIMHTLPTIFSEKIKEHLLKNKEKILDYSKNLLDYNEKYFKTIHHHNTIYSLALRTELEKILGKFL